MKLQNILLAGQFSAHIMFSLYAGLVVGFPYIIWEMWRFIKPALYDNERKYSRGSVTAISVMFFIGAMFGYFIIVPLMIHFLGGWQVSADITNDVTLEDYLNRITFIPFATGIIFELPILMVFLTKVGIITPEFMVKYRKHAIIVLMVVASVITPPDIFSMILVVLPLLLLYEASIMLCKRTVKKQRMSNL
jgi:sec-independent protein translocase protein TatC